MLSVLSGLLDPRRSLAARLIWVIVVFSVLLSLIIGLLESNVAQTEAESALGTLYSEYARQLADRLSDDIDAHLRNVQIMAGLIDARQANLDSQRELLEQLQTAYPEFAWIGLANLSGKVIAATGRVLEGQDVSAQPWFNRGRLGPSVLDVHDDVQLTQLLSSTTTNRPASEPLRFVDVTAPVKNEQGQIVGVMGAHLSWSWVGKLERSTLAPLRLNRSVEALIISSTGRVLLGPADLVGAQLDPSLINNPTNNYETAPWPDGIDYLTGWRGDGLSANNGLGWIVLVRLRASEAFAAADQARSQLLLFGLGAGLLFAGLGVWLMRRFTRPLDQIAEAAGHIQLNQALEIPIFKGQDEVARVSHSLNSLVNSLEARNRDLQALNVTLEDRVTERTQEIERLSAENQQAAVARERLRMARDLHDTLAHTLAGLLTQIRLTRKVAVRNPQAVADELALAEHTAQLSLQEARAAITNLRANPVRELGLAAALEQRLSTFAQQQTAHIEFHRGERLPALTDERAETMFRIFEETLHNIEKHARASNVSVSLQRQDASNAVIMSVCDDGVGFDPVKPVEGHYGLRGMREQCDLIRARLDVTSAPGQGTRVDVTLHSSALNRIESC